MGNAVFIKVDEFNAKKELENFFGDDWKRFFELCLEAKRYWLTPYGGCYVSHCPDIATFYKKLFDPESEKNLGTQYREYLKEWHQAHPEEEQKVINSRKEWERQRKDTVNKAYALAVSHHYYLYWHGFSVPSTGHIWDIFKDDKKIAQIVC